jgi:hypothetical protein
LLRWHAVIERRDQHNGDVDWREHVNRHLDNAGYTKHADK